MRRLKSSSGCFCCIVILSNTLFRFSSLCGVEAFRSIPPPQRISKNGFRTSLLLLRSLRSHGGSDFSFSSGAMNANNRLSITSIPKEWQDYDLKKNQAHWISDLHRFRSVLDSTEVPPPSTERNEFDTIVEPTNRKEDDDTIVFLDLRFTRSLAPTNNGGETIQIRLNRDAKEIARNAFQRLEISMAKKLLPGGKKKKKKNKKRKDAATETNQQSASGPFSRLVVCYEDENDEKENRTILEIDTENVNAFGLCNELASLEKSSIVELDVTVPPEQETNPESSNQDQLSEPRSTTFRFGVDSNLPVILATRTFESFRSKLFVGIPIVIQTTLLHSTGVEISWFLRSESEEEEELILRGSHSFVPQAEHIGKYLSVVLRPLRREGQNQRFGRPEAYTFHNRIERTPTMPILSLREKFIEEKTDGAVSETPFLRVCTYNILADLYVSRKGTTDGQTTYPHVLYEHVEKTRRTPMIVAELLAYGADIICLQEVDGSVYDAYLQPIMMASGYDGYYSNKASLQREGCAIFWSESMFEADRTLSFPVKKLFEPSENKILDHEWSESTKGVNAFLESFPEVKTIATEKLGQVLQVVKLKYKYPRNGQSMAVVVGNTHLFWHPMADHVRALQAFAVAKKIDEVRRCQDGSRDPFLLCGDLNSDPLSGASQLLTTKSIESDHHDCWNYLHTYKMDIDDNDVEEMVESGTTAEERRFSHQKETTKSLSTTNTPPPAISLPESFPHLLSGCQPKPSFTNFTPKFVETLDYVLASTASAKEEVGFSQTRSGPMPSIKDVEKYVGMPNEVMPSDHVSIVCDLQWCRWNDHPTN